MGPSKHRIMQKLDNTVQCCAALHAVVLWTAPCSLRHSTACQHHGGKWVESGAVSTDETRSEVWRHIIGLEADTSTPLLSGTTQGMCQAHERQDTAMHATVQLYSCTRLKKPSSHNPGGMSNIKQFSRTQKTGTMVQG